MQRSSQRRRQCSCRHWPAACRNVICLADHNLGYGHSIQRVAGTDKAGKALDLTVRVTDVYRKIKGHWLIIHEHVSVPVDLATGKPDLSSKP